METRLHYAVGNLNLGEAQAVLREEPHMIHAANDEGVTPLMLAAMRGPQGFFMLHLLLSYGACVTAIDPAAPKGSNAMTLQRDRRGISPAGYAALSGCLRSIERVRLALDYRGDRDRWLMASEDLGSVLSNLLDNYGPRASADARVRIVKIMFGNAMDDKVERPLGAFYIYRDAASPRQRPRELELDPTLRVHDPVMQADAEVKLAGIEEYLCKSGERLIGIATSNGGFLFYAVEDERLEHEMCEHLVFPTFSASRMALQMDLDNVILDEPLFSITSLGLPADPCDVGALFARGGGGGPFCEHRIFIVEGDGRPPAPSFVSWEVLWQEALGSQAAPDYLVGAWHGQEGLQRRRSRLVPVRLRSRREADGRGR